MHDDNKWQIENSVIWLKKKKENIFFFRGNEFSNLKINSLKRKEEKNVFFVFKVVIEI